MRIARIPVDEIVDRESFHAVFARVLGFRSCYGRSMDAWIDCLTYADAADARMLGDDAVVAPGDLLVLDLGLLGDFRSRCPSSTTR